MHTPRTRRRSSVVKRAIAGAGLLIVGIGVLDVLLTPQATLHSSRTSEELVGRYGGGYEDLVLRRGDYGAQRTFERSVTNADSQFSVVVRDDTFRTRAGATTAYQLWSPRNLTFGEARERPLGKSKAAGDPPFRGTEIRGASCTTVGSHSCQVWIFWQLQGSTVRETRFVTNATYTTYDAAVSEFSWVGRY